MDIDNIANVNINRLSVLGNKNSSYTMSQTINNEKEQVKESILTLRCLFDEGSTHNIHI